MDHMCIKRSGLCQDLSNQSLDTGVILRTREVLWWPLSADAY